MHIRAISGHNCVYKRDSDRCFVCNWKRKIWHEKCLSYIIGAQDMHHSMLPVLPGVRNKAAGWFFNWRTGNLNQKK